MKCTRCKQNFGSLTAYGIHTWMMEKDGRKKTCPSIDRLKKAGMSLYMGQWFFLSEEMTNQLARQEIQHG